MSSRFGMIVAALALAGCQTSAGSGLVKPQLPELPVGATALCAQPPVLKLGDDLGVSRKRWRATAICEGGRRASLVAFYNGLRGKLGK